jgi:hypothetical protein
MHNAETMPTGADSRFDAVCLENDDGTTPGNFFYRQNDSVAAAILAEP